MEHGGTGMTRSQGDKGAGTLLCWLDHEPDLPDNADGDVFLADDADGDVFLADDADGDAFLAVCSPQFSRSGPPLGDLMTACSIACWCRLKRRASRSCNAPCGIDD